MLFIPVLLVAFIMGIIMILEFAWWKVLAFLAISYGLGHGVYYLFRKIDRNL